MESSVSSGGNYSLSDVIREQPRPVDAPRLSLSIVLLLFHATSVSGFEPCPIPSVKRQNAGLSALLYKIAYARQGFFKTGIFWS